MTPTKEVYVLSTAVTACVLLLATQNIPFKTSTVQPDREYTTYEMGKNQAVTFLLRAGHGVARLEAWEKNHLVASTFYSQGREPAETDSLRLEVRSSKGELMEAQCDNVDKATGQ